jgi:hypothetical protein
MSLNEIWLSELPLFLRTLEVYRNRSGALKEKSLKAIKENLEEFLDGLSEYGDEHWIYPSEEIKELLRKILKVLDEITEIKSDLQPLIREAYGKLEKKMLELGITFNLTSSLSEDSIELSSKEEQFNLMVEKEAQRLASEVRDREKKKLEKLAEGQALLLGIAGDSTFARVPPFAEEDSEKVILDAALKGLREAREERQLLSEFARKRENIELLSERAKRGEELANAAADVIIKSFEVERRRERDLKIEQG